MIYQDPTAHQLSKMLSFINKKMQFEKWYPIDSELAFNSIITLFDTNRIENCELNKEQTYIRKVDLDFTKKEKEKTWYDR